MLTTKINHTFINTLDYLFIYFVSYNINVNLIYFSLFTTKHAVIISNTYLTI